MNYLKWILPVLIIASIAAYLRLDRGSASDVAVLPSSADQSPSNSSVAKVKEDIGSASVVAERLLQEANKIEVSNTDLPSSLRGTEVDGGFRVDEEGNLIVEIGIKRYFDYFMATVGEESLAEITARIHHSISTQLQEPAKSQALAILQDYLSYKTALYELEQQYGEFNPMSFSESQIPQLTERLDAMFNARRAHMSESVVDAFFAEEEAIDRYTLERLTVMHDSALSEAEKANKMAQLEQMLPEHVREQRAEATQYQRYAIEEAKLKSNNASPAEIHQLRAQEFGEEGAARLAALDEKRAVWNRRLQQYRAEKLQLEKSGLSEQDLGPQINELRARHFSEIEIRRVKALDRIAGS